MSLNKVVHLPKLNFSKLKKIAAFSSSSPLFISRLSTNASILKLKRKETFHAVLPGVVNTLVNDFNSEMKDASSWIKEILQNNLHDRRLAGGLLTVMTYELLEKPENVTDESVHLSHVMGWCTEMLQSYLLLLDDIMNGSVQRRGNTVGIEAINESLLLYSGTLYVLKKYFRHLPQYSEITRLFNEGLLSTAIGQNLDYSMAQRNRKDYSLFTIERYNAIVKYKTSYCTYKLPIFLGMLLANINDKEIHSKAEQISLKVGRMFHMQNDFKNIFENESITGKIGADIQEGKCTWLAVNALERLSNVQKKVFTSCFGSSEPAHTERIKWLYEELDLPNIYRQEQKSAYEEVVDLANSFGESSRATMMFLKHLDGIYNGIK